MGFSQLYELSFYAVDLDYGILEADFLLRYGPNLDLSIQRLFRLPEVERCCLSSDNPSQTFCPSFTSTSKNIALSELQQKFPEVFEPLQRSRVIKHSVIAKIETVTETPVWARARRLAPDKLSALREEIDRLVRNRILEKSHSSWSSPIAMVKKPSGKYRLCADSVSLNKVIKKTRIPPTQHS